MRKSIALSLLIAVSPLAMTGCSYDRLASLSVHEEGVKVSPEQYSTFIPGQTASDDVLRLIGEPSRVQEKAGREIWIYTHQRFNSNPMVTPENSFQAVFLQFDKHGILQKRWRKDVLPNND